MTSSPRTEPRTDEEAPWAGSDFPARLTHRTPFYKLTLLTSPARIEQLAVDPSAHGSYMGLINNFGPKGSSVYATYGGLLAGQEDKSFEAGRPSRVIKTPDSWRLDGLPIGPHGLEADWTFRFLPRFFEVGLVWRATRDQVDLWEAGWKLDCTARYLSTELKDYLEPANLGPYLNCDRSRMLSWEEDNRYAHTLAACLVPGSADRGDNIYVAPNFRRPVSWAAWQTVWNPGGGRLHQGQIRAGTWRIGASAKPKDVEYAAALSSGSQEPQHTEGLPTVRQPVDESVSDIGKVRTWLAKHEPTPAGENGAQADARARSTVALSTQDIRVVVVPDTPDGYKAFICTATSDGWQIVASTGPTTKFTTASILPDGSLLLEGEGIGQDGRPRTHTRQIWTLRENPRRIHVEGTDSPLPCSTSHPLHTVVIYPEGKTRFEVDEYDLLISPHLRPQADLIIGQHSMRSPVLAVQNGSSYVALVPDLLFHRQPGHHGAEHSPAYFGLALDLDAANQLLDGPCMGFGWRQTEWVYSEYGVEEGYYCRDMGDTAPPRVVELAYDLLVRSDAEPGACLRDAQSFLWDQVGHRYFQQSRLPQNQPADDAFDDTWLLWHDMYESRTVEGRTVGAVRTDREFPPDAMFMSWFNALRTAYGIYSQGRYRDDTELMRKGRATLDLLLSAPNPNGAFPTIASFRPGAIEWHASHRNFANQMNWGPNSFNTFDMGWAAYWVLRWYQDLEPDKRCLAFAANFADFLLDIQLSSGALPSWVEDETGDIDPHLRESAQTSSPALLLAELAGITGNDRYLSAAIAAAGFLEQESVAQNRWDDYEVYYSNVPKSEGATDPISNQTAQNSLSMHFAAAAFLRLFELTNSARWLKAGERALAAMLQYQAVWAPPFLSVYAFGGFSAQNTDQEWLDARQSQFGITLLDYARVTGNSSYAERGIAAVRSAYATMSTPAAEISSPRYFDRSPTGSGNENYAHNPYDLPTTPVPSPHFDWGTGSAAAGFAEARNRFGDVWLHVSGSEHLAFGIDNLHVESAVLELDCISLLVTSPSPNREFTLKADIPKGKNIRLRVNDRPEIVLDHERGKLGARCVAKQAIRIVHNPTRTAPPKEGQGQILSVLITSDGPLTSATAHYRTDAGEWISLDLEHWHGEWCVTVPPGDLAGKARLEYFFTALSESGQVAQAPEVDPMDVPYVFNLDDQRSWSTRPEPAQ